MAKQFQYDETKLKPLQREVALALVEYEFTPRKERKTLDQIGKEIGTTRKTICEWKRVDRNFINYKNHLAAQFVDSHLPLVYAKLIDSINNGSVRGIETFLKRIGDLDQKSEITVKTDDEDRSFDERKSELLKRLHEVDRKGKSVEEKVDAGGDA